MRTEHAVGDVLLARPDELHRPLDRARGERRLDRVVGKRPPSETAAEVALVHLDLLGPEVERARDQVA